MSTRANIIIKDGYDKLYFYRHSDGYPSVVKESLDKFVGMVRNGAVRNNTGQAAGWLILIGAAEYDYNHETRSEDYGKELNTGIKDLLNKDSNGYSDWKVGAYEPTTGIHGDIEHLYVVDLEKVEWNEVPRNDWNKY